LVQRLPIIVGPTAGGKSALAVDIASELARIGVARCAVVSADSMQVFRGMDIGTGKLTPAERRGVPHHLIDIVEPTEAFSVDAWLARANATIDDLRSHGIAPIVVGGTHLYAKALLEGLFDAPEPDPAERSRLGALSRAERRAMLERADPAAAARIHINDDRRTIRALEVFHATGTPISEHQRQWDVGAFRPDALLIGIEWPTESLNRRINTRVHAMMDAGLLKETRALWERSALGPTAIQALGYRQLVDHLEGKCTLDEAVERSKAETRRFAKNERTWLRRLRSVPGSAWIDATRGSPTEWAAEVASAIASPDRNTEQRPIE